MQTTKENVNNLVVETVELPDDLVKLAEDMNINIQDIVVKRLKVLKDIFP